MISKPLEFWDSKHTCTSKKQGILLGASSAPVGVAKSEVEGITITPFKSETSALSPLQVRSVSCCLNWRCSSTSGSYGARVKQEIDKRIDVTAAVMWTQKSRLSVYWPVNVPAHTCDHKLWLVSSAELLDSLRDRVRVKLLLLQ